MITFSKFSRMGRLGNQLFQYASMIGIGRKYGHGVVLPRCDFAEYLHEGPTVDPSLSLRTTSVEEPQFHYDEGWLKDIGNMGCVDVKGWLQSEKYWAHCVDEVRAALKFNSRKVNELYEYQTRFLGRRSIAISVRRGDYVDNPNYMQLGAEYYYLALLEHFPDWRDYNILVFSDDIEYCKVHFECLPNVFFIGPFDGALGDMSPMQQLIVGSCCDHFIIANSTFSWWMAYLGEKPGSKVVRPAGLFDGELLKNNDSKDFYPERWTEFDHRGRRLELGDVTITIPVSIDSDDRRENYTLTGTYLQKHFATRIIVGHDRSGMCLFPYGAKIRFGGDKFHRTHMLNRMAECSTTPYVVNYDCDVLLPPLQLWLAIDVLRRGEADYVYPYDGQFARVPRAHYGVLAKHLDVGRLCNETFKGTRKFKEKYGHSVGGVVCFRKEAYMAMGGEDERYISYAPEDVARFYILYKTGRMKRVRGVVYHVDHEITMNSSTQHEDYERNRKIAEAEIGMRLELAQRTINELSAKSIYNNTHYARPEPV